MIGVKTVTIYNIILAHLGCDFEYLELGAATSHYMSGLKRLYT